jgi:hypothetical protein
VATLVSKSFRAFLCFAVVALCFSTSCGHTQQSDKLIDQINAAKVKARSLSEEAQLKLTKAKEKNRSEDRDEHDRLIDEAATLCAQASDVLNKGAEDAKQLAKLKSPGWYQEYFSLQAKLIGNLAKISTGAHDELLARKNGAPTDSQVQAWKEDINRISKENEELRRQISAIETRQRIVLIKE